jgi:rod shape determining protein RodA
MIAKEAADGGRIDYVLSSLYLSLVGIGILMIYAEGYKQGYDMGLGEFMMKTYAGKQMMFFGVSMVITLLIFTIDAKFWRVFAYPIYGVGIFFLIMVLIFGKEIHGTKSWFNIAGFGFQPVELAKLGTCIALASYIASPSVNLRDIQPRYVLAGILGLPIILTLLQPDPGSLLVFFSFSIMLFREGLSPTPYIIGLSFLSIFILALKFTYDPNELVMYLSMLASLLFGFNIVQRQRLWIGVVMASILVSTYLYFNGNKDFGLILSVLTVLAFAIVHSRKGRFRLVILGAGSLIVATVLIYSTTFAFNNFLKKHHQERINIWLGIGKVDPRGAAYNLNQSKMAIGSGGFQGKGFLEGTMTKLNFVPEQHTDYIFCTIGEEQGFIGVFAVIVIYVLFLYRIIQVGERNRSNFVRIYAYGLAGIFFFHFFINVGMTMGLVPTIGIPLPFISAGGSSLMFFSAMLAILIRLDSNRYMV